MGDDIRKWLGFKDKLAYKDVWVLTACKSSLTAITFTYLYTKHLSVGCISAQVPVDFLHHFEKMAPNRLLVGIVIWTILLYYLNFIV